MKVSKLRTHEWYSSSSDIDYLCPPAELINIKHPNDEALNINKNKQAHEQVLDLTRGIYLMEEWWQKTNLSVSYPIAAKTEYFIQSTEELEELVREFHHVIGPHQRLNDRHLVFGVGATQMLHAAIYALCVAHGHFRDKNTVREPPLYFTHQTPGYLDAELIIKTYGLGNAKWIPIDKCKLIDSNNLVEIITSPNNPDGRILSSITTANHLLHDRVNLWPFFTPDFYKETMENDSISIFSLAKIFSFSSSRVGYSFVRDPQIAHYMRHFVITNTHGIAGDCQLRGVVALRYLIENNKCHEYVNWIRDEITRRWQQLIAVISESDLSLLNNSGPNIWLRAPSNAKHYLFEKYRILGTYGPEYGATANYVRLNMHCTRAQFDELLWRLANPRL